MNTAIEKALIWVLVIASVFFLASLFAFTGELLIIVANTKKSEAVGEEIESRLSLTPTEPNRAVLIFVGDIMLSRSVDIRIRQKGGDYTYPFWNVADALNKADLVIGNLENPISSRGYNQGSIYSFRAKPEAIEGLSFASFDVLSLANNHIWDWGRDALIDTVTLLEEAGIDSVGAGENYEEANRPILREVRGEKIAILAYTNLLPETMEATATTPGLSDFDIPKIMQTARELKTQGYLVLVSLHWGEEYEPQSNSIQQEIARGLIDAGVDIVVGHHPHVAQELEQYANGWIAYSLGNFVFDQDFSPETMKSVALKVELEEGKIVSAILLPVELSPDFQPSFVAIQ